VGIDTVSDLVEFSKTAKYNDCAGEGFVMRSIPLWKGTLRRSFKVINPEYLIQND
jgi:hypothetical protein